jgi:hypothetical protein
MKWISIKEKLPSHTNDVIVIKDDSTVMMARYRISGGGFWALYFSDNGLQYDKYHSDKVTHWMELPRKPQEVAIQTPEHFLWMKLNEPPELLLGDGLYHEIIDAMECHADQFRL